MRILLLNDRIPPEGRGGAESVVWRLAKGLRDAGQDVHVLTTTPDPSFDEVRDGIPTYHIHADYPKRWRAWLSLWNPQTIRPFKQALAQIQPDVANVHNIHFWLSYHTLKLIYEAGIPTVFTSHDVMPFAYTKLTHFIRPDTHDIKLPDDYRLPAGYNLRQNRLRYNPFRNRIIRHYLQHYTQIRLAPSQALADAHVINGLPPFQVCHNGIDVDTWTTVDPTIVTRLRDQLNLHDKRVILMAGRLTSHKGTGQLLSAMDALVERLPDMRLLVLTAGDIDKQIPPAYHHLRPFVLSGGWLSGEELVGAYQLADVMVVPSVIFDTFPTVNLEAMASGLPVIATPFGGSREVVVHGETGYIINPFDTMTFSDTLYTLLTNEKLRVTMGQAGQSHIRQHFTLQHQLDGMLAYFQQAIQQ